MEISNILGLPAHPLLVHAAVVLTPLAALALAVCALWPAARQRFGWIAAGLAVATAVLIPLVLSSGESLEGRVTETALVEKHANLGEQLLPWSVALAVLGLALMFVHRRQRRAMSATASGTDDAPAPRRFGGPVLMVISGLLLVAAVGSTVQVALIGHSGAQAVWSETTTNQPTTPAPDAD